MRRLGLTVLELRLVMVGNFQMAAYEPDDWEELLECVATVF
ncbi:MULTISPECIES: hypothetical protein [unclassified Bradyrhizobium]|nr:MULTISPECIES: hypothetical protein [unclassified Bradyrhizobium]